MQVSSIQNCKIFNNRYMVKKKISAGSFGVVFLGYDKNSKEEVAIKLEKEDNEEVKSLDREVQILKSLQNTAGVPKLHWAGQEQDFNVMIIQLLGKDLSYYMKQYKKFSLKTVLLIAQQAISVMERIHTKSVVHRDLKPENILMGRESECGTVYIVDFGISKIYRDSTNKHMQKHLQIYKLFFESVPSEKVNLLLGLLDTRQLQLIKAKRFQEKMIQSLSSLF